MMEVTPLQKSFTFLLPHISALMPSSLCAPEAVSFFFLLHLWVFGVVFNPDIVSLAT